MTSGSNVWADWFIVASAVIVAFVDNVYDFEPVVEVLGKPSVSGKSSVPGFTSVSGSSVTSQSSTASQSSDVDTSSVQISVDSKSPSVKISKLNAVDKQNIRNLYSRLDEDKMWHLSNGTIAEKKMQEVAVTFQYEHPSHSLILDVNDVCSSEVFEAREIEELGRFRSVKLPIISNLDPYQLYTKIDTGAHQMASDSNWLQSNFSPLESQTEGNVVKRIWSCLDSCFDFSTIRSVSGEKCSKAIADASNKGRCLSDVGRQSSGRKMDYIFTTRKTGFDVGCGECALVGGAKTTKELVDAGLKMPKVMRDIANSIFATHNGLVNDFCAVGYYIGADTMQLLALDFPAGYVGRLDGFDPAVFPKIENQIHSMQHVLILILNGRMLMENEKAKIERSIEIVPGRLGRKFEQIVPTFVPASDKKKRKVE